MTKNRYEVPTWNQVYKMLLNQTQKIIDDRYKPDVILGISRGGSVPARILSDLLENSNLAFVRVESRQTEAEDDSAPTLTEAFSSPVSGKKVLIVDDVSDTGQSLNIVKKHVFEREANEAKVATLYYKPWSILKPDYYEKETRRWIIFPWDLKENLRKIMEKPEGTVEKEISGVPKHLAKRLLKQIKEKK